MHPTYEQHLLGRLLPPMAPDDFQRLAADIAAHGLLEEIVLYQGTILDGWSRYRACQARGIKPRFREFTSHDPVAYVLSRNVQRRHLSVVQILRVLEAARPALEAEAVARKRAALHRAPTTADPVRQNSAPRGRVNAQIAQMAGVSKDTVKDYRSEERR